MLTIAQITDLHVTTDSDPVNRWRNAERLNHVLKAIHALKPRPVAIIASGDLVDRGEPEEYAELIELLKAVEIPIYFGIGNHDRREPFLAALSGQGVHTDPNGFIQYAADLGGLRLVVCDTLDEASEGGAFCEDRARWLAETLDEAPHQPTVIALHHPPIASGIRWMDPDPQAEWIARLGDVIRSRDQVKSVLCGHVHRAFNGVLAGRPVAAAPATSIQLTLDLSEVDMYVPDGREMLVEEPPGFALVMAYEGQVNTHVCVAGDYAPAVAYTSPFIRS